ncbi:glucose-6-phosphate isomerase [unidentified eubacterium SCB49]|nr:glucose-6-phosphate isomerase [unidentified eubacterium SCB49]
MPIPKINPTTTNAWQKLEAHFEAIYDVHIQELFASEKGRRKSMSFVWEDVSLDYSKNRISAETFQLLLQLAEECKLKEAIDAQYNGETINETEGRAVLHTALRDFKNLKPEVEAALEKMRDFSEKIISGDWKGHTGKAITDIVNIGVGGSSLGPAMTTEALSFYKNHLNIHYVSNVDGDHVMETLKKLDPETTLFIVVSKSFTTQETLTNANTIRKWFVKNISETAIANHFVAVSANNTEAQKFGISEDNIFPMWDWVGGRFSLWSAVGLSTCCSVGYEHFEALLKGAHAMDEHFKDTSFDKNMPVIMAMLSVWYNNFFQTETEMVLPYSQYLSKLVNHLQQAVMESNGKSIDRNGAPVEYQTGTVIWGSTGVNAQHAFMQLLHQGTKLIPTDFICFETSLYEVEEHQEKLLANCYAQADALAKGTFGKQVENNFKRFEGNSPSNMLKIEKLTPNSLGKLIALYEHKLFVQGVIWNIYSYDQWGVELGKKMANDILSKSRI